MSSLIMARRNFLRAAGGLVVAATVLAMPAIIRPALAEDSCGGNCIRKENVSWENPGSDPFAIGDAAYKRAPYAIRALEGLEPWEMAYFLRESERLADGGWSSPDVAFFLENIVVGGEWEQMRNGRSHHKWVRDRPDRWKPTVSRRQFVLTLTNEFGAKVQISIPEVCINARSRRLKRGQVRCIPLEHPASRAQSV